MQITPNYVFAITTFGARGYDKLNLDEHKEGPKDLIYKQTYFLKSVELQQKIVLLCNYKLKL